MIDVKGVRFLYTKQTCELIIHHLVKSFNYKKLRRNDYSNSHHEGDYNHKEGSSQDKKIKKLKKKKGCDHDSF